MWCVWATAIGPTASKSRPVYCVFAGKVCEVTLLSCCLLSSADQSVSHPSLQAGATAATALLPTCPTVKYQHLPVIDITRWLKTSLSHQPLSRLSRRGAAVALGV